MGDLAFYFSRNIRTRYKLIAGALAAFCVAIITWNPLFILFSLLKNADSYYFRYAYVVEASMVIVAAAFFARRERSYDDSFTPLIGAGIFSAVMLFLKRDEGSSSLSHAIETCAFAVATALVLFFAERSRRGVGRHSKLRAQPALMATVVAITCIELGSNCTALWQIYCYNASSRGEYTNATEDVLGQLKEYDSGSYRITETSTWLTAGGNLTANYNEAMAFGYWSNQEYTSDPNDNARALLDRLGFRECGENLCVVNSPIIPADSLLGVRYALSNYPIPGLEKVGSIGAGDFKAVYENPYALQMGVVYTPGEYTKEAVSATGGANFSEDSSLTFDEYQEALFSELSGSDSDFYDTVDYTVTSHEDDSISYLIEVPVGATVLYGQIYLPSGCEGSLYISGEFKNWYGQWLSPSVFLIPVPEGASEVEVTLKATEPFYVSGERFVALELDKLEAVTSQINAQAPESLEISGDGYVTCTVQAEEGQSLFLSIPYNHGWKVTVNGHDVYEQVVAGSLISIPLESGENVIEMQYYLPMGRRGPAVSVIAVVILVARAIFVQRRRNRDAGRLPTPRLDTADRS